MVATRLQELHATVYEGDAFDRDDDGDDTIFYGIDRMVHHLDETARAEVSHVIGSLLVTPGPAVLDLMSSWESHLPSSVKPSRMVGLGMNLRELEANAALTERVVHDLNRNPRLPFPDGTFDAVLNCVSVDYLTKPFEVFAEVGRVLRPGGLHLVVFSSRMFPTKAVKIWRQASEDERRLLVEDYFAANGHFASPHRFSSKGQPRPKGDKYEGVSAFSDPVIAVWSYKLGGPRDALRPVVRSRLGEPLSREELERRKERTRLEGTCPHCGEPLKRWQVPLSPFSEWDAEFLDICFNDACPFLVRGWSTMAEQGNGSGSYRLGYHRGRNVYLTIPVQGLRTLRDGIVE